MSSDRYGCAGCEKYFHELDMVKDQGGALICKECEADYAAGRTPHKALNIATPFTCGQCGYESSWSFAVCGKCGAHGCCFDKRQFGQSLGSEYQICCSRCNVMARGIGKEATEQGVRDDGWITIKDWWVCDECKPKAEPCRDCGSVQVNPPPRCEECWKRHHSKSKPLNAHYKHGSIDPCQYVEAMGDAEYRGACILNILKYVTRYPHKGTPMEDLMKAQDYVNMLIEHQKKKENKS